jgi:hypothetical protein
MVHVPITGQSLSFTAIAYDLSGNHVLFKEQLAVKDVTAPTIIDHTGKPITDSKLRFDISVTDNFKVKSISIFYTIMTTNNGKITDRLEYQPSSVIGIPRNAILLAYRIEAIDTNGNKAILNVSSPVLDNISPIVNDNTQGTPNAGQKFKIEAGIEDNINVSKVIVEYWYNNEEHHTKEMQKGIDGNYYTEISVENKENLQYFIKGMDISNNTGKTEINTLKVKTSNQIFGQQYLLIILLIIICSVLIILIYLFKIKRERLNQ